MSSAILESSASEIIEAALLDSGIIEPDETPGAEDVNIAFKRLATMIKRYQAQGHHLWSVTQGTLFLNVGQESYELGSEGAFACKSKAFIDTTTTTNLTASTTIIPVTSTNRMNGAPELITINPISTQFWTVGNSATLTAVGGNLELTSSITGIGFADFDLTCEIGATYRIINGYVKGTDTGATFSIIDPLDATVLATVSVTADDPAVTLEFTATQTTMTFRFSNDTASNDAFAMWTGGASNYFDTNDSVANSPAGDFQITADIEVDDWSGEQVILSKFNLFANNNNAYGFKTDDSPNALGALLCDDGLIASVETVLSGDFTITGRNTVSIKYNAAVPEVEFFINDLVTPVATVAATTTSIFDSNFDVQIGFGNGLSTFSGKMYNVSLFDSGSTLVMSFDPGDYVSGTSFVSSLTGETWDFIGDVTITPQLTATNTLTSLSQIDLAGGDFIGIKQDDNTRHWTKIVEVQDLNTVEINDGMVSASTAGKTVFVFDELIDRPMSVYNPRSLTVNFDNEIPIEMWTEEQYSSQPLKSSQGTPVQVYYTPQIPLGEIFIWQTAADVDQILRFTYDRPLLVATSQIDSPDFPSEWFDALKWNLAKELLPGYSVPPGTAQLVLQYAQESLEEALAFDEEQGSLFLQPDYRGQGR